MAEMALGYGSEYQLLRYLGHHRNFLDSKIKEATKSDSPIEWMDYPVSTKRHSLDGEYEGIEFFGHYKDTQGKVKFIQDEWVKFWPQKGSSQNWDGIFWQDNILYLVEAKAHLDEMKSPKGTGAKGNGRNKIIDAFYLTCKDKELADKWADSRYYQLANRLAFAYFCNSIIKINAKLCYIYFINGFKNGYIQERNCNVGSAAVFKQAIEKEYEELQINQNEELKKYILDPIFIDAFSSH